MNTLNKILFLIIIILIINHLTDCKIIETINSYFFICKKKVEGFIGLTYTNKKGTYSNHPEIPYELQKDFPYNNKNDPYYLDNESNNLYDFMTNLINVNANHSELISSRAESIPADEELVHNIMNQLSKVLNSHGYIFNNITLLDKIHYHENYRGKEIELFNISADVSYRGKSIGSVLMNFEIFLIKDKICLNEFKNGLLTIKNVKLLDRKYPEGITKKVTIKSPYIVYDNVPKGCVESQSIYQKERNNKMNETPNQIQSIQQTQELASKMTESFTNNFVKIDKDYDNLFIKPTNCNVTKGFMNDTDNSLIPSICGISSYEEPSLTACSN
jgi:hypothetical protein